MRTVPVLLALLALTACGAPPSVRPAWPSSTTPAAASAATEDTPAPDSPRTSFGDGTWVVGEDIEPGRYRSAGARAGAFEYCQITTHSDLDGASESLEWENGNANEPIRVNISGKVKSVKATGCEDFAKVG